MLRHVPPVQLFFTFILAVPLFQHDDSHGPNTESKPINKTQTIFFFNGANSSAGP